MEWTWKLPPSLGGGDFVMRELTVAQIEQIQDAALMAAGVDEKKLVVAGKAARQDCILAALVSWKGKPLAEPEAWWRGLSAKELALLSRAYEKIHSLSKDEEAYFDASLEAVRGNGGRAA